MGNFTFTIVACDAMCDASRVPCATCKSTRTRRLDADGGRRCEGGCSWSDLAFAGLFAWSDSRSEPTLLFYRKFSRLGPRLLLGRRNRQPRPDLACKASPIVSRDQAEGPQTHGSFLRLLESGSGRCPSFTSLARLIDLVEHATVAEMRLLSGLPAAEDLVNREQLNFWELTFVLSGNLRQTWPVEILGGDLLPLG